jgi:hypothetical protein
MFSISSYLDPTSKKYLIILSLVLFIFFAVRYFCGNYTTPDSQSYLDTAEMIKNGSYFQPATDFQIAEARTIRPFIYPLFLLLFGSLNIWIIIFAQTFVGIFNVFLTLLFYRKLNGKSPGLVAFFLIFTPSVFILVHLIMTEFLTTTLTMLLAVLLMCGMNRKNIFSIQIVVASLAFVKPAFYPFVFISFLLFVFYYIQIKKFNIAIFIPIFLVLSYIGFNKYRTGYTHFSSIENVNLISYNIALFKEHEIGPQAAKDWEKNIRQQSLKFATFKERSNYLSAEGIKEIKENFWSYCFYHASCSIKALVMPGRSLLMVFLNENEEGSSMQTITNANGPMAAINYYLSLIKTKGMIGFINLFMFPLTCIEILKWLLIVYLAIKKRFIKINFPYLYLLVFIFYGIFINGPVAYARYLVPLQGIFICFAALGWEEFKHQRTRISK